MRRRLGSAARARALEYFTVDEAINTFDEIYHFLGSGHPLPAAPAPASATTAPAAAAPAPAVGSTAALAAEAPTIPVPVILSPAPGAIR
jgi:hypothetical protein